MLKFVLTIYVFIVILSQGFANSIKNAKTQHQLQPVTTSDVQNLASRSDPNYINKVLDNILIPRVAGSGNHEKVYRYIVKELKSLNWHIATDEFHENVPILGTLKFKNIVATPNPQAHRFLVLACHYDSKYFQNVVFVGAIDSAVPCAMMLEIARTMAKELGGNTGEVAIKMIFFDGEEAFKDWGPRDSIWGAKHLAQVLHSNKTVINGETLSDLDRMDVLVLLDLIGMKNPTFLSFFESTQRWFVRLSQIEQSLQQLNLLKRHRSNFFKGSRPYGRIEDDHVPFLKKNVPVLHLISTPFPPEWHTPKDNRDIVDMDTVVNLNLILKTFITEYLHLSLDDAAEDVPEKELFFVVGDVSESENPIPLVIVFLFALIFFLYRSYYK